MRTGTYTTGVGKEFKLTPSSPYQIENYRLAFTEQFEADNPKPKQPTYRTETAGGGFEELPMDETSAETPEQIAEVLAFKDHDDRLNNHVSTRLLDVMIVENVVANPQADKQWLAKKKFFNVKLPEDEVELKLYYVREHLLFDPDDGGDFAALPTAIMQLSGIRQQAVAAGKATFRNTLRKRNRQNGRPDTSIVEEEGEMVHIAALSGDADGETVGIDTKSVG